MAASPAITEKVKQTLLQMTKHLEQHYQGLQDAFLNVDAGRQGWLSKQQFIDVFNSFNFPVQAAELDALIDAFDANKDGRVSYLEFCNTLCHGPWSPMRVKELPRPDIPGAPPAIADNVKKILMHLAKHLDQHYEGLQDSFLNVDSSRQGWLSKEQFAAVFSAFHFPITSAELDTLIDAFDANKDGRVSYLEFCNTMSNGPWAPLHVRERPYVPKSVPVVKRKNSSELKLVELLTSLQRALEQRFTSVQEAFMHLDRNRSGFISAQELIAVLHNYNVRVTWEDIQLLVDYFDTNHDGLVSWMEFVRGIQMNKWNPRGAGDNRDAPAPKPSGSPAKAGVDPTRSAVNILHQEVRRYTTTRFDSNKDAFLAVNTTRSGAITGDEFGLLVAKASNSRPTAEVVARLFGLYDLNSDGLIQFNEYVRAMNKQNAE